VLAVLNYLIDGWVQTERYLCSLYVYAFYCKENSSLDFRIGLTSLKKTPLLLIEDALLAP